MPLPLLVAGAGALAGAIGAGTSLALKTGQNARRATNIQQTPWYDPNASNYNGRAGGLQAYGRQSDAREAAVEARGPYQADYGAANYDRGLGLGARTQAHNVANMMAYRAAGLTPSIAQQQADRQMQQATAAQASAAASARGAGGLALAQQNAAGNTAALQSSISNQAQINAAQERERAEQAAYGAYAGLRSGDIQSSNLSGNQAQFQTEMQQRNRDANDSRAMGYEGLQARASEAQLQAKMQQQGQLSQSLATSEALNQQTAQANANRTGSLWDKIIPSDENAKIPLLGGLPGSSGGATSSLDKLKGDGSMDVTGSLKAHSDFATRFGGDPGSESFLSDTNAKRAALLAQGRQQGVALARGGGRPDPQLQAMLEDRYQQNTAGREVGPDTVGTAALHRAMQSQVEQDRADTEIDRRLATQQEDSNREEAAKIRASFGHSPANEDWQRSFGAAPSAGARGQVGQPTASKDPWWMTPVDKNAFSFLSDERTKTATRVDHGDVADGNRAMVGSAYAYKPGLTPSSQAPGEANFGPMAQNLEREPVTATAVKEDPATGLKVIDRDKAIKVAMAGIADLQRQQDEMRMALGKGGRK